MSASLHHVSITCQSLTTSLAFYQQFGFEIEKQYQDDKVQIVLLSNQTSARIELFQFHHSPLTEYKEEICLPHIQRRGITHFAICVSDIETTKQQLSGTGKCSEISLARLGGFRYFFTLDPDGNQLEIIEENNET